MDNAALQALFAQQQAAQQPATPANNPQEPTTEELLTQEQALDTTLNGNNPTEQVPQQQDKEVAEVLPTQENTEEDQQKDRVLPKAKPKKEEAPTKIEDAILLGMPIEEERETIKSPLKNIDDEQILRIIMQADNSQGLFTPSEESIKKDKTIKKIHEEIDKNAKIKLNSDAKALGKYETQFQEDILKHPQNYKVNTPRGEMNLRECFRSGYNPETQEFGETPQQMLERHIQGLDPAEQQRIRDLVDINNLHLKPEDAEARGIDASPEMLMNTAPENTATGGEIVG